MKGYIMYQRFQSPSPMQHNQRVDLAVHKAVPLTVECVVPTYLVYVYSLSYKLLPDP